MSPSEPAMPIEALEGVSPTCLREPCKKVTG